MAGILSLESRHVHGTRGRHLGRVTGVLFHLREPKAVGLIVTPDAWLYIIPRPMRFVALSAVERLEEDAIVLISKRLPGPTAGERALGYSWDATVMWRGMPVRSEAGEHVGAVHDARFPLKTGVVGLLRVSTGVVGDVALGRLDVDAEHVRGFDGEAVVVSKGYAEIDAGGGMAKGAATVVATAKVRGEKLARDAYAAGKSVTAAAKRSLASGRGRAFLDIVRSWTEDDEEPKR